MDEDEKYFLKSSTNVFYQGYKAREKKSPNESIVFLSILLDNEYPEMQEIFKANMPRR